MWLLAVERGVSPHTISPWYSLMQDDQELKVLTRMSSEHHAQLMIAALARRGIDAHLSGSPVSDFKVGVPGQVSVFVRPEDYDPAQQALTEMRSDQSQIDWLQVDVGQPE